MWRSSVFINTLARGLFWPVLVLVGASQPSLGQDSATLAESRQRCELPAVSLVDQHDRAVVFNQLLSGEGAVALQFIFTSCPTICPVLSRSLAELARNPAVRCVSISIDPIHDRPAQLADYARELGAGANWSFLTGDEESVRAVQKAFDAYRRGKQQHRPLTFLRPTGSATWLRVEGFPNAAELSARLGLAPPKAAP